MAVLNGAFEEIARRMVRHFAHYTPNFKSFTVLLNCFFFPITKREKKSKTAKSKNKTNNKNIVDKKLKPVPQMQINNNQNNLYTLNIEH